jgi:DNA-directed RNA polymerase subunit RPC12/RpoP
MQNKCPVCGGRLDTEFVCVDCGRHQPPEWMEEEEKRYDDDYR